MKTQVWITIEREVCVEIDDCKELGAYVAGEGTTGAGEKIHLTKGETEDAYNQLIKDNGGNVGI